MAKSTKASKGPELVTDNQAKKDAANAKAKLRRAKIKELNTKEADAREMAAVGALTDDPKKIEDAKLMLAAVNTERSGLVRRVPQWEQMPDGRWIKKIELGKSVIEAKIEITPNQGWYSGAAVLTNGEMTVVQAVLYVEESRIDWLEEMKRRIDLLIKSYRAIARG